MPCRNRFGGLEVEGLGQRVHRGGRDRRPVVVGDSAGARETAGPRRDGPARRRRRRRRRSRMRSARFCPTPPVPMPWGMRDGSASNATSPGRGPRRSSSTGSAGAVASPPGGEGYGPPRRGERAGAVPELRGLVSPEADWCGQCFAVLRPPRPATGTPMPEARRPPQRTGTAAGSRSDGRPSHVDLSGLRGTQPDRGERLRDVRDAVRPAVPGGGRAPGDGPAVRGGLVDGVPGARALEARPPGRRDRALRDVRLVVRGADGPGRVEDRQGRVRADVPAVRPVRVRLGDDLRAIGGRRLPHRVRRGAARQLPGPCSGPRPASSSCRS